YPCQGYRGNCGGAFCWNSICPYESHKALALRKSTDAASVPVVSKGSKDQKELSTCQLGLLGVKTKAEVKPSRPIHHLLLTHLFLFIIRFLLHVVSQIGMDKPNVGARIRISSFCTPTKSLASTSPYLVPMVSTLVPSVRTSGLRTINIVTLGASSCRKIVTEEMLEEFLADVDEKITQSAGKLHFLLQLMALA
ncbi:Cytochrome B561-related, partial [Dillenia turbinata]